MFKELIRAFFSVVRSPLLLLSALLAVLANLAIVLALQDPITALIAELLAGSLQESASLYYWVSSFIGELFWIGLLVFATILVNSWLALAMARFARLQEQKELNVLGSTVYAIGKIPRLLAWSILLFLIGLAFLLVFFGIFWIGQWNAWIAWLLFILWILFFVIAFFVLSFAIPASGIEDSTIKNALQKSLLLVQKNLGSVLVFFVILGIFLGVIAWAGNALADAAEDEMVSVVVLGIFLLIQSVIANLALPFYYLEKKPSS